jgi:hypothetical protein
MAQYYQKIVAGGRFNALATLRMGLLPITCEIGQRAHALTA